MSPRRRCFLWAGAGEAQARADLIACLEDLSRWTAERCSRAAPVLPSRSPDHLPQALHFLGHRLRIRAEHTQLAARLPALIDTARVCAFDELGELAIEARMWRRRLLEHALLEQAMDEL